MENFFTVTALILPVIVSIILGYFCKVKKILSAEGVAGINSLISNILLPIILFKSVSNINFTKDSLVLFIVIFFCMCAAFGFGFLIKKSMGDYSTFTPFLIASFENGLIGYSLFSILAGSDNVHYIASVDLGNALFSSSIFIGLLATANGGKISIKATAKNMLRTPPFVATLLAVIVGVSGLNDKILSTPVGGVYSSLFNFLITPISFLIFFSVGYKFDMSIKLLSPVLKTIFIRFVTMAVLFFTASKIIFFFMPYDHLLQTALILTFSLPASFMSPIYTKKPLDNEYTSSTLSLYFIITIIVFSVLAYYII